MEGLAGVASRPPATAAAARVHQSVVGVLVRVSDLVVLGSCGLLLMIRGALI